MLTRRRFLTIAASAAALPLVPGAAPVRATPEPVIWRGVVMGGTASMTLIHPDREAAKRLIARSLSEIERLEAIFSLYRSDSALSRLNAQGTLNAPPLELVELLGIATAMARQTDGAFDPSVQPLFELYAKHFAKPSADSSGPSRARIDEVIQLVDHRAVEIASDRVRLGRAGMGITLNGIAQGYITDRLAALLRAEGLDNVLLDLGEIRAVGRHPDDRPWRAALADPTGSRRSLTEIELEERPDGLPALATSGGYGLRFDAEGRHHHLFVPKTGRSADYFASVSVAATSATLADGLSTALSVAPPARLPEIVHRYRPAKAYFADSGDSLQII